MLAIDLSRASLAYAVAKTRTLGLDIEYAQADIMRLGTLQRRFDLIDRAACCIISPIPMRAGACCFRCCVRAGSCGSVSTARSRGAVSWRRARSSPRKVMARRPRRSAAFGTT